MAVELTSQVSFLQPAADDMEEVEKRKILPRLFDPYIGSQDIVFLDNTKFQEYLNKKEAALVMFYDPSEPKCTSPKDNFVKAASSKPRDGHSFAVVDCGKESELCSMEAIDSLPYFKLYFRGRPTCYIRNSSMFPPNAMLKFVDNADVIGKAVDPRNKVKSYCEALWSIAEKIPLKNGRTYFTRPGVTALALR